MSAKFCQETQSIHTIARHSFDRTRGNGHMVNHRRFPLNIGKPFFFFFFTVEMTEH